VLSTICVADQRQLLALSSSRTQEMSRTQPTAVSTRARMIAASRDGFKGQLSRRRRHSKTLSKLEASRICTDLDVEVAAFRDRPLTDTSYPYVFLDAPTARPGSTIGSSPRRW
jgi:Transposase, Mutator family